MEKITHYMMISFLVMTQTGCATIVSGKTQDVMIRSNPIGAAVTIDDVAMGTTPMLANLVRKKRHQIKFAKDGYEENLRATTRGFNWWYVANLVFGGVIGLIVDPCTGAIYDVEPSEVTVNLSKIENSKTTISGISVPAQPSSASSMKSPANNSTSKVIPSANSDQNQLLQSPSGTDGDLVFK